MKQLKLCMTQAVVFTALVLFCYSCQHARNAFRRNNPTTTDSTETSVTSIRDRVLFDTITIPADTSAWMAALLSCDSFGVVMVNEIINQYGERSRLEFAFHDSLVKSKPAKQFVMRCKCDSAAIIAQFVASDTTSKSVKETVTKIPVPVPADLTWWEKFKIEYGGYAFGVIAAVLLFYLIRLAIWAFSTFTPQGAAVKAGTGILSTVFKLFSR